MSRQESARVRASLHGFWKRQQERAKQRKEMQERYRKTPLPVHGIGMIHKRPLDPKRNIYPAQRTPEVHTELRRVS